jgi:ACT domain-containing protein
MKTIITVIGQDKVGIIANVSNILAEENINISDISQTILQNYFTMIMVTQLPSEGYDISVLQGKLNALGENMGLEIRVQHEAIFDAMHRI